MNQPASFGEELKRWRNTRGRAQLDLANLSGYSQRHISFLERGRSLPSRRTVVVLAEALDIPLKDRNKLLQAAGFAPMFSSEPIDSDYLSCAVQAFEKVLDSHRPFPAIVVDRAWNLYAGNDNAFQLFQMFLDEPLVVTQDAPLNVLRLCLSPKGVRPHIKNFQAFGHNMLAQLRHYLDLDPANQSLQALIAEFESDPELRNHISDTELPKAAPISVMEFARGESEMRLFTLVSQLSNPRDTTLAELRIETFLPVDDATRHALNAIDAQILAAKAETERNAKEKQPTSQVLWMRADTA